MTSTELLTALGNPDRYRDLHAAIDEPGADHLLDDRERHVRTEVRRVVAEEVAPRAAEVDRTHTFAEEGFQALARAGWVGLLFSPDYGGTGDSTVAYTAAMEEITAGCAATSMIYMTQTHAGYPIVLGGEHPLVDRMVPALLDGSAYGSLAITEPNVGSDVSELRTTARADADGGYRIIRGGENIPVADVESLVFAHPDIENAAVVGYPDERLGERAAAVVVLRPGRSLGLAELCAFLRSPGYFQAPSAGAARGQRRAAHDDEREAPHSRAAQGAGGAE